MIIVPCLMMMMVMIMTIAERVACVLYDAI